MPKTRVQKEEAVVKLKEKLEKAKALVFADYQQAGGSATQQAGAAGTQQAGGSATKGLTMSQLTDLRNKLKEVDAEFTVTKNTVLQRALPASNFQLPTSNLEGPTATLLAYDDQISPIKILVKAFKDYAIGRVKFGFLGKESLDEAKIIQLSTLPTKDELRAKTVGVLVAPLQGMVSVLQGNLRNLVYALNQIKLQKGGE